jgi:hypothetical protein
MPPTRTTIEDELDGVSTYVVEDRDDDITFILFPTDDPNTYRVGYTDEEIDETMPNVIYTHI